MQLIKWYVNVLNMLIIFGNFNFVSDNLTSMLTSDSSIEWNYSYSYNYRITVTAIITAK